MEPSEFHPERYRFFPLTQMLLEIGIQLSIVLQLFIFQLFKINRNNLLL
jgi:hypothetical protein